ncbi:MULTISPECIES: hypothetical protein [Mesorhizobium]|uniref:hypothetical protein n=1 Tax=unclassified Mesorhizobium TaxID=325217 RepID=UPI001FCE00D6|nr:MULTISPECIES: hypothetical protein [Mesorhizobium]MDF3229086.1 hypothetical protein [Mesorhizobium sp. DSM 30133]
MPVFMMRGAERYQVGGVVVFVIFVEVMNLNDVYLVANHTLFLVVAETRRSVGLSLPVRMIAAASEMCVGACFGASLATPSYRIVANGAGSDILQGKVAQALVAHQPARMDFPATPLARPLTYRIPRLRQVGQVSLGASVGPGMHLDLTLLREMRDVETSFGDPALKVGLVTARHLDAEDAQDP